MSNYNVHAPKELDSKTQSLFTSVLPSFPLLPKPQAPNANEINTMNIVFKTKFFMFPSNFIVNLKRFYQLDMLTPVRYITILTE